MKEDRESQYTVVHAEKDRGFRDLVEKVLDEGEGPEINYTGVSNRAEAENEMNEDVDLVIGGLRLPLDVEGAYLADDIQAEYNVPFILHGREDETELEFEERSPDQLRSFYAKEDSIYGLKEEVESLLGH